MKQVSGEHQASHQLSLSPEAVLILASYLTRQVSAGQSAFADPSEWRVINDLQCMLAEDGVNDPQHAEKLAAARRRFADPP